MTKDEVLKLALEAFEEINKLSVGENAICLPAEIDTAMDACREALAQPEHDWKAEYIKQVELHNQTLDELRDALAQQEPVIDKSAAVRIATSLGWEPKRTWVGLTGFEQKELMAMSARDAVFATEAKLKEKNT